MFVYYFNAYEHRKISYMLKFTTIFMIKPVISCFFILLISAQLFAFEKAEYNDLHWEDPQNPKIILDGKKFIGDIRTIPDKTNLLKVEFTKGAITVNTDELYKINVHKKEVIVNFYGIRSDRDGVRIEDGKAVGDNWNVFSINIKGTPGAQVAMIFVGHRKNTKKGYRVEKKFFLDGTDQKLVFEKEFPSDLETFGLRMDLRSSGTFTFSSPDFKVKEKEEDTTLSSNVNYILNGGAEHGFDNIYYNPISTRDVLGKGFYDPMWFGTPEDIETFKTILDLDKETKHSGKYSFKLRYEGNPKRMSSAIDTFAFNPVPYEKGKSLTYTVWAKAEKEVTVQIGFYLGQGTDAGGIKKTIGTDWTKIQFHLPQWGMWDQTGKNVNGLSIRNYVDDFHAPPGLTTPIFVIPGNVTVWIDDASVSVGEAKEFTSNPELTFRSCKLDKDSHTYVAGEEINADVIFENCTNNQINADLSWELFDFMGKSVAKEEVGSENLVPNEEYRKKLAIQLSQEKRGPFNLVLTLAGNNNKVTRTFYFGVIDKPYAPNERIGVEYRNLCAVKRVIPIMKDFRIGITRFAGGGPIRREFYAFENAKELHENGFKTMYTASLHHRDQESLSEDFSRLKENLTKYGKYLDYVETQNEPNINLSPEYTAGIIKTTAEIFQKTVPGAKIVGPALCGVHPSWLQAVLEAGADKYLNIISYHPYNSLPEAPDYGDAAARLIKLTQNYLPNAPHFASEAGTIQPSKLPDNKINDYVRQATSKDIRNMLLAFGNGVEWYMQFGFVTSEVAMNWNVLYMGSKENNSASIPAPILYAMRNLADRLEKGKTKGKIELGTYYRAYVFDKGDSRMAALWKYYGEPSEIILSAKYMNNITAYDMFGSRLDIKNPLALSKFPIYIETQLTDSELKKLITEAIIKESASESLQVDLGIVNQNTVRIAVHNVTSRNLKNINVVFTNSDKQSEKTIPVINVSKTAYLNFTVDKPISLAKELVKCQVSIEGTNKTYTLTKNIAALLIHKTKKPIKIDGNIDDWSDIENPIKLTSKNAVIKNKQLWDTSGNKISAMANYTWDDNYLYFYAKIKKEKLEDAPKGFLSGKLWNYDGVQFVFDALANGKGNVPGLADDDFDYYTGVINKHPIVYRASGSNASYDGLVKSTGVADNVKCAYKSYPGYYIIEIAFPALAISPFQLKEFSRMKSGFIINLNLEGKRIGYLEFSPGVGTGKKYPGLLLDTVLVE